MKNVCALILAAGKGERMGSDKPKALLDLAGKPIIYWSLKLVQELGIDSFVVVGYKRNLIKREIARLGFAPIFIDQEKRLGTAHSVKVALKKIPRRYRTILVLFSDDSALYKPKTIRTFIKTHLENNNGATFLTSFLDRANPIGGLNLDKNGHVVGIFRQSYILTNNLKKYPILCGAFCFERSWLSKYIVKVKKSDLSGEYPLPYIYEEASKNRDFVNTFSLINSREWVSINTLEELALAEKMKEEQL
jgi:bifunctional UDP-N-acetylglucosamine pyrophosphorylase/glucosamine-1-phosphate N-acetyltransferase